MQAVNVVFGIDIVAVFPIQLLVKTPQNLKNCDGNHYRN